MSTILLINSSNAMDQTLLLTNLDQVKALADPLRLRILEILAGQPQTTKQVARQLGEKPTRLYHHVELLEDVGLVRLVETRPNRGTIEKYYQSVAASFILDYRLFQGEPQAQEALQALQEPYLNLMGLLRPGMQPHAAPPADVDASRAMLLAQMVLHASPEKIKELVSRLKEWAEDCRAANDPQEEATYGVVAAFYPLAMDRASTKPKP
ncbi:MAG: helix-turn-helix domain-containing protein [Chloroflexi bacterium]|nr:helix-turn-helix domain-containing protein [Chloroflexota bacterium]